MMESSRGRNMIQKKWKSIALYIGLACAILLNLVIALRPVFSYDESYTIAMARNSFSDIVRITANDVHAPLYYFMVKIIGILMGGSIYAGRVLSLLCVALFVLLGWKACKKTEAKAWLLLFAFTQPLFVTQATESRMYTAALLFFTCSNLLGYRLLDVGINEKDNQKADNKKNSWLLWGGLTITAILAIYMHTYTMLMMVLVYIGWLCAAIVRKQKATFVQILFSGIVVGISYLPWLVVLKRQFATKTENLSDLTVAEANIDAIDVICKGLNEWFADFFNPNPMIWILGVVLSLVWGYVLVDYALKTKEYLWIYTYMVIVIVLGVTLCLVKHNPGSQIYLGRYVFPAFGLILIGQANALADCEGRCGEQQANRGILALKIGVALVCLCCGAWAYNKEYRLEDTTGLKQYEAFLEENYQDGDIILANTRYQMAMSIYHPEYRYMVYGILDSYSPYQNTDAFREWPQLDGVNRVWAIHANDINTIDLSMHYDREHMLDFHYGYYDWNIEAWTRRE